MITPVFAKATQSFRIAILISLFFVGLRTKLIQPHLVLLNRRLPLNFWLRLWLWFRLPLWNGRLGLLEGRLCFRLLPALHQAIVGRIEVKLPQGLRVPFPHSSDLKLKGLALLEMGFNHSLPLLLVSSQRPQGFHLILLYQLGMLTRQTVP